MHVQPSGRDRSTLNMSQDYCNYPSKEVVSSADIRKELFEGDNIRTRETDKATKAELEKTEDQNVDMTVTEKDDEQKKD